ncbi:MAG TPA: Stp1/IreP family PP2C-type Ser/Thr phosphatase [Blastocatellia bacterium]
MFKLFKRKSKAPDAATGAIAQNEAESAQDEDTGPPLEYSVHVSLQTDVGCHRQINEDNGRYTDPKDDTLLKTRGRLTIVADGMGGHSAGEVASNLAVEVISRAYFEGNDDAASALKRSFLEANSAIHQTASKDETLTGMGTTSTALVLRNGSALAAHVGDSRLYLIRNGQIYLMTEDHSAVMEMVKQGMLSLEEARHHPEKNVILRALGSHADVEVTTWQRPFPLRTGDRFLLCSDGLYDLVEDNEILQTVSSEGSHEACEKLIAMAKDRGGYDNITVAIVSVLPVSNNQDSRAKETRQIKAIQ